MCVFLVQCACFVGSAGRNAGKVASVVQRESKQSVKIISFERKENEMDAGHRTKQENNERATSPVQPRDLDGYKQEKKDKLEGKSESVRHSVFRFFMPSPFLVSSPISRGLKNAWNAHRYANVLPLLFSSIGAKVIRKPKEKVQTKTEK